MNLPSLLPLEVRHALGVVRVLSPEAVVSGGFVRDTLLGVKPRDIDVFCGPLNAAAEEMLVAAFPGTRRLVCEAAADYVFGREDREVSAVWDLGFSHDGCPMQLIVVTPATAVQSVFKRNDFGICQLQDDGVAITMTKACARDIANKTFTLVECENAREKDRSMARWERLRAKYPGYRLVVPTELAL